MVLRESILNLKWGWFWDWTSTQILSKRQNVILIQKRSNRPTQTTSQILNPLI